MTRDQDEFVRRRAAFLCEYCQLPQDSHGWKFEIDHIIAEQHGGATEMDNLALCCPRCNRNKGPNIAGVDPDSRQIVALYNPRRDVWGEHFQWDGPILLGQNSGRASNNSGSGH